MIFASSTHIFSLGQNMALENSQVNLLAVVLIEPFSLSQISVFYQKTETSLEM